MEIIGYTYNAACHCEICAEKSGMDKEGAIDNEGNEVGIITTFTEFDYLPSCDDCLELIEGATCIGHLYEPPLCLECSYFKSDNIPSDCNLVKCEECGQNMIDSDGDNYCKECQDEWELNNDESKGE